VKKLGMGDVGKGGGVQYEVQDRRRGKREGFVEEERGRKREEEGERVTFRMCAHKHLPVLITPSPSLPLSRW
jgi:hypothetical protein